MELDKSIIELGEKLDAWCDNLFGSLASKEAAEQRKSVNRGIEMIAELDGLKAKGLDAIAELLARQEAMPENQRIASLTRGFVFGVKLADTLHDELLDVDGETKVLKLVRVVVDNLESIGSGQTTLMTLLDHPDAGVRVAAGTFLLDSMPDRVIPILRQIADEDSAASPCRAHWTLLRWERDGKIRSNSG